MPPEFVEVRSATYLEKRVRDITRTASKARVWAPGALHESLGLKVEKLGGVIGRDAPCIVFDAGQNPGGGKPARRFGLDEALGAHWVMHVVLSNPTAQRHYRLVVCGLSLEGQATAKILLGAPPLADGGLTWYVGERGTDFLNFDGQTWAGRRAGLEEALRAARETPIPALLANLDCVHCESLKREGLPR